MTADMAVIIRTTRFVVQPSREPKLRNIITIQAMLAPEIRTKNIKRIIYEQDYSASFSVFLTSLSFTRMQHTKT